MEVEKEEDCVVILYLVFTRNSRKSTGSWSSRLLLDNSKSKGLKHEKL